MLYKTCSIVWITRSNCNWDNITCLVKHFKKDIEIVLVPHILYIKGIQKMCFSNYINSFRRDLYNSKFFAWTTCYNCKISLHFLYKKTQIQQHDLFLKIHNIFNPTTVLKIHNIFNPTWWLYLWARIKTFLIFI